ncbi:hypothetical protein CCHR01_17354 [Colletotrichum chrysophilum]|uniref:Uncharacterized protein n=1 Tax=Colletotrichum chrysophilum TaxID=1836956 RepID=A0AAD9A2K3_9PEZI|nr:hypothetical protein CCHR01_17354 [Colletotrichum chrysophilum]
MRPRQGGDHWTRPGTLTVCLGPPRTSQWPRPQVLNPSVEPEPEPEPGLSRTSSPQSLKYSCWLHRIAAWHGAQHAT